MMSCASEVKACRTGAPRCPLIPCNPGETGLVLFMTQTGL